MVLHKVFKYLALVLALIAGVFFIYTLVTGDDAIQGNTDDAQNSTIVPMMYLAYAIIALILGMVLVFVFKNLFSSPAVLKKSLFSVGMLVVVALVSYFLFADDGTMNPMTSSSYILDDGKELTASSSKLIGASIYMFYIMAVLAIGSILWAGVSKMLNK